MSINEFIPLAYADVEGNEEKYVLDALRSSWISSSGKYVSRFEEEFARICGTSTSVGVCNGTIALHLALLALDVRPGDEVLVPSLTYIATANAVRYVGGEPVFIDIDVATWCIDPSKIEEKITRRTKGIIAVHLYGHPADMDAINHIAGIHGLWVVEDAAEAHTAKYKGRPCGGLARIGTFSFYGNKIFTCGEGGALSLDDVQLEKRIRTLRGQGVDPDRRYFFPVTGYNFRLTNVACAILCGQLERKEQILESRNAIFNRYTEQLSNIPGIHFQPVADWATPAPWLYSLVVDERDFGCNRDAIMNELQHLGIETRPFFIPLHTLPPFREQSLGRSDSLPITEDIGSRGLSLPTFNIMTENDVDRVCDAIRALHKSRR